MSKNVSKVHTSTKVHKKTDNSTKPTVTLKQILQLTDEYTYIKVSDYSGKELISIRPASVVLKKTSNKNLLNAPIKQITSDVGTLKHNGLSVFVITFVI